MLEAACDSLLKCLGVVADVASVVLHMFASFVGLLLAALDGAWRLASLAASVASSVLGAAFAAASAVGEFAIDVGHLLAGCVKFAVFVALSAASGVHSIAGALEALVTALGGLASRAWQFAVRAADGWASVPRWAAASAETADVRAFESTSWLLENLAKALAAAASCLAQAVVGAVRFALALPRDAVVWVESLVEEFATAVSGALLGAGRAVVVLLTDGAYSAAIDAVEHQASRAARAWNSACDDWPSKLLVCAAILGLFFASVAERYRRHRVWWRRGGDQDDSEHDSESDGDHVHADHAASGPASSARPFGSPGDRSDGVSQAGDGVNQTGSGISQTHGAASPDGDGRRSTEQAERWRPPTRSSSTASAVGDETATPCGGSSDDDDLSAAMRQLQQQLDAERDKQLCVVCQHSPKSVLLLPCRHLCVCPDCAQRITTRWLRRERSCPLCRTEITNAVEAYT